MKGKTTILSLLIMVLISTQAMANEDYFFSGIFCPDDVYVSCSDELWDLSIYGNATYKDYNGTHDAGEPTEKWHLNSCDIGHITRTWKVKDPYGRWLSCSQTIHVGGSNSFNNYSINWPDHHVEVEGCNPDVSPEVTGYPTWYGEDCSKVGRSYKDQWFQFAGDCKKLIRTWKVMDWCEYDPAYNPNSGIYTFKQTIKVTVDDTPVIECPEKYEVHAHDCDYGELDVAPLYIDPSVCGGHVQIKNDSRYAYANGADISGIYPVGTTWVNYLITYGCGTTKKCKTKVIVKSGLGPTPYCYATMTVVLMGTDTNDDGVNDEGMVEVWAKDFDAGSFANCSYAPLKYSFSSDVTDTFKTFTCDNVGENILEMWVTDEFGAQSYCIVIVDVQNNGANIENCEAAEEEEEEEEEYGDGDEEEEGEEGEEGGAGKFSASGNIHHTDGELVTDLEVMLINLDQEITVTETSDTAYTYRIDSFINASGNLLYRYFPDTTIVTYMDTVYSQSETISMSDEAGNFMFDSLLVENNSYMLHPGEVEGPLTGIDMDDVNRLFNHLIDYEPLTTVEEYIAADLDGSGVIDFMDFRQLLLYVTKEIDVFPAEYQWRIVEAGATVNDENKDSLNSVHSYSMLMEVDHDMEDIDFMVVQLGNIADTPEEVNARGVITTRNIDPSIISLTDQDLVLKMRDLLNPWTQTTPTLFPNPVLDNLTVDFYTSENGQADINIYNLDGKLMKRESIRGVEGQNQQQLNVGDLHTGLYIYTIKVDGVMHRGKLMKE